MRAEDFSVSVDPGTGLISIAVRMPDGSIRPVVGDAAEMRRIGSRLLRFAEEAEARGDADATINPIAMIREELGRDPFGD